MSFQYKEPDKRGNPTIKYVAGDWIVAKSISVGGMIT